MGQVTTLVSVYLQGELGLPGPPGVPGLIVSTPMPGAAGGCWGDSGWSQRVGSQEQALQWG